MASSSVMVPTTNHPNIAATIRGFEHSPDNHSPLYAVDEAVLPLGMRALANLALRPKNLTIRFSDTPFDLTSCAAYVFMLLCAPQLNSLPSSSGRPRRVRPRAVSHSRR
jgi:hypothetical protein